MKETNNQLNNKNKEKSFFAIKGIQSKNNFDQEKITFSMSKLVSKKCRNNKIYPLSVDTWDEKEIFAIKKVISSGNFTMGDKVKTFEKNFAEHLNTKYAVMVNSGSSANLVMISSLVYNKDIDLNEGDEVIVPSLSWATTYFPLKQCNLKARFIDIDIETLNIDVAKIENAITKKTRAIFAVNILGNPVAFDKIKKICKRSNLLLIEDNCESLGAKYEGKYTGTIGLAGTYSFYFSHHIHTIEGGMITTNDEKLYQHMLCLRAHGWIRDLPDKNHIINKSGNKFEDCFKFALPGYNLRSSELNAAIGIEQIKKLDTIINVRRKNASYFNYLFNNSDDFILQKENSYSSWFGFSLILKNKLENKRNEIVRELELKGIETRPIVSGNFLKNPAVKYLDYSKFGTFENSDNVDKNGFFVGNNHLDISYQLQHLKNILEDFKNKI